MASVLRRLGRTAKKYEAPLNDLGKRSFFRLWKIRSKVDRWTVRPYPPEPKHWRTNPFGELPDPDGGRRRWASWETYFWSWWLFWAVIVKYAVHQWRFINYEYWANEEVIWQMNEKWCRDVEADYLWVMYNRQKDGLPTPMD